MTDKTEPEAADQPVAPQEWKPCRIKAAPKIRQVYFCDFPEDAPLPEMGKNRPVIVVSFKNPAIRGSCTVVPCSTDPQEGWAAEWAHELSFSVSGDRKSWVVCNHLYTVSNSRLSPLDPKKKNRIDEAEFDQILSIIFKWLPKIGAK